LVDRHPWPEHENRADSERADEEKVIPWAEGNGLWAVIARITSDLAAVDVITFLVQNPYVMDSAQSIAERIGRHLEAVAPTLESLAQAGFVDRFDIEGVVIYELTADTHHRQTLQQYVTWLQEAYHWARLVIAD
jgi:hypothetical protein